MKGGDRPGKVTETYAVSLASRLTERDRKIALDCFEHRVLTTEQLRRLHFNGTRTARARLGELYALRVLDRFRPPWQRGEGSTPFHWVLDEAGAHIVAQALGLERAELRWRHATAIAVAGSSKLQHQIEVNEFFTRLAKEVPAAGGKLVEWRGDRHAAKLLGGLVRPGSPSPAEARPLPGRREQLGRARPRTCSAQARTRGSRALAPPTDPPPRGARGPAPPGRRCGQAANRGTGGTARDSR
jgi:hypothetical protein